jgi:hypothetical protein
VPEARYVIYINKKKRKEKKRKEKKERNRPIMRRGLCASWALRTNDKRLIAIKQSH